MLSLNFGGGLGLGGRPKVTINGKLGVIEASYRTGPFRINITS